MATQERERVGLERDEAPDRHHETDAEEPVGARSPEFAFLSFRLVASAVLPDGEAISKDHRQAHGEDHEDEESVQVEDLNDVDVVHGRNGSQRGALGYSRCPIP